MELVVDFYLGEVQRLDFVQVDCVCCKGAGLRLAVCGVDR